MTSLRVLFLFFLHFLLVVLPNLEAFAQVSRTSTLTDQYYSQTWVAENGKLSNIYSINQSREGFIWIGCDNGVFIFDGINFLPAEESMLDSGYVCKAVCVLQDSSVICGFNKGRLIHYRQGKITDLDTLGQLQQSTISAICEDLNGGIWIGTDDAGLYFYSGGSLTHYKSQEGLPSNHITSIVRGDHHVIWAGTQSGLCRIENGKITTLTDQEGLSDNYILSMCFDSQSRLWIGTHNGLNYYQDNTIQVIANGLFNINPNISAITEDSEGNIWISSFGKGVYILSSTLEHLEKLPLIKGLPSSTMVSSMFCDNESSIWFGSMGNFGISQLQKPIIQTFTQDDGLSGNNILPLYRTAEGKVWIGNATGGLDCFTGGGFTNYGASLGLGKIPIFTIGEDSEHLLWIGSEGNLTVFDGSSVIRSYQDEEFDNASFHSVYNASDGSLWIGTNNGIFIFRDGKFSSLNKKDGLSDLRIFCLREDRNGNMWIGTQEGGINIYKKGTIKHLSVEEGLSDNMILCMLEDEEGTMWIGTGSGGLNRVDFATGQIRSYRSENGLDNTIYQILEDSNGYLWLGVDRGILSIDKEQFTKPKEGDTTKLSPKVFNTSDVDKPLSVNGGIFPSGCKLDDGSLWFPTSQGIAVIHPDRMHGKVEFPQVVIQKVLVNNILQPSSSTYSFEPGVIHLEIKFTAPTFISPNMIQFRYKLVGYDDEWIYPEGRSAYYTRVPHGDYEFQVQSTNRVGQWNDQVVEVPVSVKPYFYQTTWFLLLLIFTGLFVIYAATRYRIRYIREKELEVLVDKRTAELRELNRELDRRVLDRTAELAAANQELEAFTYSVSHDLRAPVRRIEGLVEALSEDYASQLDETGKDLLKKVTDSSVEMGQLIEEFLKLARIARQEIDKTELNLSYLVSEIINALAETEPERKVRVKIKQDVFATGDSRLINIALQNLLNNAWKYTGKEENPEIIFSFVEKDGQTVYFIRDNGVGFDMSHYEKLFTPFLRLHSDDQFSGTGIGLATVKRIIVKHGGKIWAQAEPGKGSTFFFTL